MLIVLSSLLLGVARAGPVAGLGLGVDVPLAVETESAVGPAATLMGGWVIGREALIVQPELFVRLSVASGMVVPALGCALLWGEDWRGGAYAHAGLTVLGGQPAVDAGLLAERALGRRSSLHLRTGYALAPPFAVNECVNCPKPADHWATVELGLSWRR